MDMLALSVASPFVALPDAQIVGWCSGPASTHSRTSTNSRSGRSNPRGWSGSRATRPSASGQRCDCL